MTRRHPRGRWAGRALALAAVAALVAAGSALAGVGTPRAMAADTLLSQGKVASASSTENPDYTRPSAAFDGNATTRWASARSDPQWLEVDLGATDTITSVELDWESAYATAFRIETSADERTWTPVYSTTSGRGGNQVLPVSGSGRYVRMYGTARGTGYGYSLWEMKVYGTSSATAPPPAPFDPNLDPGESATVPAWQLPVPSTYVPPPGEPTHHEFQTDCSVTSHHPDDPIVFPKQPGASHDHTFLGNPVVDAYTTTGSLTAATTTCTTPGDRSGYWFPTLYNGTTPVLPVGPQVIYYKSGVSDYRSVIPFPRGLRYVTGSPMATRSEFQQAPGAVEGWECGTSSFNWDIPATCPPGSDLVVRYQAPSCWDGVHLDVPGHKSHMAYPVDGHCTADHPVAVPMLEFKIAFRVSGDMANVHLASGRGFSWHYDFFNAWDADVLAALVTHCIDGGLQCDPRGFDQYKPDRGAALDQDYRPVTN